jgi:type IV secretory pathway VirB10-like protein
MPTPLSLTAVLAVAALFAAAPAAAAKMYRWIDSDGTVVYSQTPPPGERPAVTVAPPPPPPEPPEVARQRLDEQLKKVEEAKKEQQKAVEKEQKAAARSAEQEKYCENARRNLELLENRPPRRYQMPNGEFRTFSEQEQLAEIQKLKDYLKKSCP